MNARFDALAGLKSAGMKLATLAGTRTVAASAPYQRGALGEDAAQARRATAIEPLLLEWFTLAGLLVFGGWLLGVKGVWQLLLTSDPTGLTLVIIVLFTTATIWWRAFA